MAPRKRKPANDHADAVGESYVSQVLSDILAEGPLHTGAGNGLTEHQELRLVQELAAGRDVKTVARICKVSRSAIVRRRADPRFQNRVRRLAIAQAESLIHFTAGEVLSSIRFAAAMRDDPAVADRDRLAANRQILDFYQAALRSSADSQVQERLVELETTLTEITRRASEGASLGPRVLTPVKGDDAA